MEGLGIWGFWDLGFSFLWVGGGAAGGRLAARASSFFFAALLKESRGGFEVQGLQVSSCVSFDGC